ncbi:DUF350 domain-containing protein [Neptuniibacter sp. SY11_33]|uniref:DUF350 domain-containing protein n=1 Tax=Neptuniibacter sp. SY11_33 TaxID=3398215 RepID=UPI0039F601F7
MNIEQYGIYILYTLIYIGYAVVLKYVLNFMSSQHYDADDQLANGNLAVGLRRTGAQFGLAIAMMGVLSGGTTGSLTQDLMNSALYGLAATMFMVSTLILTDKLVTPGIDNLKQLKENNTSVGMVELGMLVSTGIISYSSIYGEAGGLLSTLAYFVIGQVTLVVLIVVYEKVFTRHFDIVSQIGKGNLSAGVYLGGKLIAYALILKSAIVGNGGSAELSDMVVEYIFLAVSGMLILYLFEFVIDLVIVTSSSMKEILNEDRIIPAVQLSSIKIGMALILSNAIL